MGPPEALRRVAGLGIGVYDIERYLNIRSAHSPSLGPEGDLAFLMDTTGVSQVWRLDEPRRWPTQLTFREERVSFASWSRERPELVFGMDEGGNEREQLFRLSGNGASVTPLTGMPDAKHRWGGWSHDGDRFAFTSNRRDEAVFDVYVQDRDASGEAAELVHEGDGWLTVGGWSPDDDRLIVHEAYSNFDMDVSVLSLEDGTFTHVTPHDGDVRYGSVTWGPAGEGLYLTTDEGTDTLSLRRLDLTTLDLAMVASGGDWNVDGVVIDHDTRRIAYTRNLDGYTDLTVGTLEDETTIEPFPEPDLPRGVYGTGRFGPDGERLPVTVTAATRPTNVWIVDVTSGVATRWTDAATAGIPRETFIAPETVHYETFDGREIPAFFSVPSGAGPFSVVVDIHGGPESQRRPSFSPVTQYLLNAGYAVFEPNVRGSTGYGKAYSRLDDKRNRLDSVRDVHAGLDWLAARPDVDADRIVAMGASYGGFMVLACLTEEPDRWAAGVDIVGIANFITFLENTGDWRRSLREAEYGSLTDDREFLASISPVNRIDRIAAPLMVLHGANDPRVPVEEAEQIAAEAAKHVPTQKLIFEDEGHGFSKLENRIEAYRRIVDFLDDHV